jgi:hypothetical protein
MDFLKKNSHFFACGAALLSFVVFFVCFGAGVTLGSGKLSADASVYDLTFGNAMVPGVLIAWILLLVGFLASVGSVACTMVLKNKLLAAVLGGAACLVLLVSGILYFLAGPMYSEYVSTGVGAVFCGILNILAALLAAVPCVAHFLLK